VEAKEKYLYINQVWGYTADKECNNAHLGVIGSTDNKPGSETIVHIT
jgi:hypothetical protein